MRRERLTEPRPVGGQHAAIERMVLGEPRACAEGLLEDGRAEALGQVDERGPGLRVVRTRADDDRRRPRFAEKVRERVHGLRPGRRRAQNRAVRRRRLPLLVRRFLPVAHRHDHERRPAPRRRRVVGALDRCRHVLCLRRLLDRDRVLAGQPGQPPGEERLVGQMPPVLLADDDDERRAVHARRGEAADRRPQPGRRVQEHERRLAAADRVPARHRDHGAFVEAEHEAEVVGEAGEERHLGRAGVREHGREPAPAEDVEGGIANGPRRGGAGRHGPVYTRSSPGVPRGSCDDRAVSDPADLGVVDASSALRRRELSSRELVSACLARIRERDGQHSFDGDPASVNAWVRVYEEDALSSAAGPTSGSHRATRRRSAGSRSASRTSTPSRESRSRPRAACSTRCRSATATRGRGWPRRAWCCSATSTRTSSRPAGRPTRSATRGRSTARPAARAAARRRRSRRAWFRPRPGRTPPARCASRRRCAAPRRSSRRAALVPHARHRPALPDPSTTPGRWRAAVRDCEPLLAAMAGVAPPAERRPLRRIAVSPRIGDLDPDVADGLRGRARGARRRARRAAASAGAARPRHGGPRPLLRRDARLPPALRRPARPATGSRPRLPRARASDRALTGEEYVAAQSRRAETTAVWRRLARRAPDRRDRRADGPDSSRARAAAATTRRSPTTRRSR